MTASNSKSSFESRGRNVLSKHSYTVTLLRMNFCCWFKMNDSFEWIWWKHTSSHTHRSQIAVISAVGTFFSASSPRFVFLCYCLPHRTRRPSITYIFLCLTLPAWCGTRLLFFRAVSLRNLRKTKITFCERINKPINFLPSSSYLIPETNYLLFLWLFSSIKYFFLFSLFVPFFEKKSSDSSCFVFPSSSSDVNFFFSSPRRHNDLPWNIRKFLKNQLREFRFGEDLRGITPWSTSSWSHTDLRRLKEGMVSAQVSKLAQLKHSD